MPRWLACALAATALVLGSLLLAPAASGAQASVARSEADVTPLRVTIATLAPATTPRNGRVTLTGTVTNRSQRTWSHLNVYLVTSATPMTTRNELATAARTPADTPIGSRLIVPGSYLAIGSLGPGQTIPYRL